MCFSLCCKLVLSLYNLVSHICRCGAVCWCPSMHTHTPTPTPQPMQTIVDVATSVGPIRGAAIARLVDLALLLQAAGLTTLARTTLNTKRENILMA